ncbi:RagB/SusD family nutrient uptake outer membrane protein [Polluticaenibacter yanchengensis]|uniref:RagB/SusD family nutrient uptake outer membrane protein n=1 Tax=Polluticaenibacter yanchengensis TaxID=3014562 RepID=A0ABT4UQZ7_9BACT|nr:RagB/SusD family nutrient uptake outer membrane protein [Chitinophagaceae bacterium LY-5]
MLQKRLLGILLASTSLVGCSKFLDKNPDNRTELNSVEKVSNFLTTAYPFDSYINFTEAVSDNSDDKSVGTMYIEITKSYQFEENFETGRDTPSDYWDACYSAIAVANQSIDAINQAPDPQNYRSQLGEALVCRAYAHFMLVTLFSKSYDPATASTDLGIPYVTEPETVVFKNYERKNVAYVYEQIEKDLTEGLPLLDDNRYKVPKYHFTRRAANAFASRFYLFKKDFAKVVTHSNEVFPDGNVVNSLRDITGVYRTYTADEQFMHYTKATEPCNLLIREASSLYARKFASGRRYGYTPAIFSKLFGANVTGSTAWGQQRYNYGQDHPALLKWKEYFHRVSVNANTGFPHIMAPLFTTEEVLFNRAEAYAELGEFDKAAADLTSYASKRFTNFSATYNVTLAKAKAFYPNTTDKAAMINAVLDLKRTEFIHDGLRWFDMLRHKIPVRHKVIDVTDPTKVTYIEISGDDNRRVFQIPEITAIAGLQPNPR